MIHDNDVFVSYHFISINQEILLDVLEIILVFQIPDFNPKNSILGGWESSLFETEGSPSSCYILWAEYIKGP